MNKYLHPLHPALGAKVHSPQRVKQTASTNFQHVLEDFTRIKVSKHAKMRLQERNIHISNEKWQLISEKMNEASEKGVTDALVVMDNVALVVSTKNKTVVTAMHQEDINDKIFTNINGTIIL